MIRFLLLIPLAWAVPRTAPVQDPGNLPTPPQNTDELRDAFAGWRVDVLTREDGPEMLTRLRELSGKAEAGLVANPANDALATLLGQMWTAELDELEQRRDAAALAARTAELLGHALRATADDQAQARAARLALDVARVERAFAQPDPSAAQGGRTEPSGELIAAAVQDAVRAGDADFLAQVGPVAVPTLRALSRTARPTGQTDELDPLSLLAGLAPDVALDVALEHASSGDILRKTQVVRALELRSPFAADRVWTPAEDGRSRPVRPAWAGLVSGLLSEPAVPARFLDPHLAEWIRRDYGGPVGGEAEAAIEGWLLRHWPAVRPVPRVVIAAAERMARASDPDRVRRAAQLLALGPDMTPLYTHADTRDPRLRASLAPAFGPREVDQWSSAGEAAREPILPTIDEAYWAALDRFVRGRVDEAAATALEGAADVLPRGQAAHVPGPLWETWLGALEPESSARLGPLLRLLGPMPGAECRRLTPMIAAWIAAAPEHSRVADRVDALLDAASANGGAAELRLAAQACSKAGLAQLALLAVTRRAPAEMEAAPADAPAWLDWMESQPDFPWRELVELKREARGSVEHQAFLKAIPATEQLRILRALCGAGYDRMAWLDESDLRLDRAHWLELVADRGLAPAARLWAMDELCETDGDPLPAGTAQIIARAIAAAGEAQQSHDAFRSVGVDPEQILLHLLDLPGVEDATLLDFYLPLKSEAVADRVRQRFPPSTWRDSGTAPLLSALIWNLVGRSDPSTIPDLVLAAESRGSLQRAVAESVVAQRNPLHIPVAGALLEASMLSDKRLRRNAVNYVSSFVTDESIGYLLAAARKTGDEEYREELFTAAQRMLAWRELEDRWRESQKRERGR